MKKLHLCSVRHETPENFIFYVKYLPFKLENQLYDIQSCALNSLTDDKYNPIQ